MSFSVLFVCTGNICRSPAAEALFDQASGARATATSAGLAALTGAPVDPPTFAALTALGLDPHGHRARQLATPLIVAADLVLTAEAKQRDEVMLLAPMSFRRTFTLLEFCRTAAEVRVRNPELSRPDQIATLAARYRGIAGQTPAGSDDIADVYGGTATEAQRMVAQTAAAIDSLVYVLRIQRPRPRSGRRLPTRIRPRPFAPPGAR